MGIKKILCWLVLANLLSLNAIASKAGKLDKIHQEIIGDYAKVSHVASLAPDASGDADGVQSDLIIIDVREPDEYAVSHIEGAVRVAPDITADDFLSRFGNDADGKTYVFYCSVGRRSSELISRVQAGLLSEGASTISNLTGGVFKWHNDRKALVNQNGATTLVHPYNFWWKRLLEHPQESSYAPTSGNQAAETPIDSVE